MITAVVSLSSSRWRVGGLAAVMCCLTGSLCADPPLNDDFANRAPLVGPTNHVSSASVDATKQPGEPSHLKIPTDASVWWSWTAPDSGTVTINTVGSDFDTALAVYIGSELTTLELVMENDDTADQVFTSMVSFNATAGTEYQIVVDGPYAASGNIELILELPVAPSGPSISTQPQGLALVDRMESNAVFRVGATGSYPLLYQWQLNGTNLPNATGPELVISNVVLSHAGTYRVVVSNAWGWATSSNAVLRVAPLVPNDGFVDRIPLYGATNTVSGSTVKATRESGEPNHLKMPAGHSLWWSWIAPDSGQATVNTVGSDYDTTLSVYAGGELASLALVARNDDADGKVTSRVSFPAIGGVEYQIAVDGSLGAAGQAVLTVTLPVNATPPRIDRQPRSRTVGDGGVNRAAFNAEIAGSYPRFYQWQFKGADLQGATEDQLIIANVTLEDDGPYRLIVSNAWGSATSSNATLNVVPPVPNDYFANRLFMAGSSNVVAGSLAGATAEPDEPSHSNAAGGHSIWWSWIAPANGRVEVHGAGTNVQSFSLAAYTGSVLGSLIRVASGTNENAGSQPARASIEFWVAAGTAYQIAVDGDWNQDLAGAGGVALSLLQHSDSTAVANDNFAGRFILIGATNRVTGSNVNATREASEPEHLDVPIGASVWWTWIAPETGRTRIETHGSSFDTTLSIYTGETLVGLILVAENDDDGRPTSGVEFEATAGTTYQIAVDGFQGANGDVILNVVLPLNPTGPFITTQPQGQVLVDGAGSTATFRVEVTGSYPRYYQWQLDGADLPDAIGPRLVLTSVGFTNAGNYSVVVSNAWGVASSSNATLTVIAPIPNDDFAGRISIAGASHSLSGSNVGASREPGEPGLAADAGGQTLWWSWTAPADGLVSVDARGSSFNVILGVYTGASLDALSLVAASPGSGRRDSGLARFRAVAEATYLIQVDGYNATNGLPAAGSLVLNLAQFPNNDFFANSLAFPPDATAVLDSNVGATLEAGEPNHAGNAAGRSVWWFWTATNSSLVTIDTDGSSFPALLAVYSGGTLETLRLVDQDDNTGRDGVSRVRFLAAAGTRYRIAVDGSKDAAISVGDIVLNINWDHGAGNDNFADRISLAGQESVLTASNLDATSEPGEPGHAGDASAASVWWSWVAPLTGSVILSTLDSDFDTRLAVYTGTAVDRLSPVAQNDDYDPAIRQSQVEFDATAGQAYEIAVDGYVTDGRVDRGSIRLSLFQTEPPVEGGNDHFANRFRLRGGVASTTGSNINATREQGEPNHAGNPGGQSLWWSWRPRASGPVTIDTLGSSFATVLAVYTGVDVGGLTPIAADNGVGNGYGTVTFVAENGTEYLIAVDGFSQGGAVASGAVTLNLFQNPAGGGSANDSFENRASFPLFTSTARGFNIGATSEAGEPDHAGLPASTSVWWSWTAPDDGPVTLDTRGSGFDTVLAVYTGTSVSSLELVAANDDIDMVLRQSKVRFQATAGTEYQIAVDSYGGGIGSITLNVHQEADAPGAPVVTQQPADQTRYWDGAGGGSSVTFSVVATGDPPLAYQWQFNGTDMPGRTSSTLEVAFSWRPPAGGASSWPPHLGLYNVRITNSLGAVSSAKAALRLVPYAFNDGFTDRIRLTGFINTANGSCLNASKEAGEPNHAGTAGGQSVWWSWVAPSDGMVSMETVGSSIDTVLAVYTGSTVDSLSLVAANDDIHSTTNSASRVQFQAEAGVEYQIALDAAKTNNLTGSVALNIRQLSAALRIAVLPSPALAGGSVVLTPRLDDLPSSWTYQWFAGNDAIPGANQRSLVLSNLTRAAGGPYSLVVSNSLFPAAGSVNLQVQAPQWIRSLRRLPDGKARLSFSDPDGTLAPDTARLEVHSTAALEGANTVWQTNIGTILQSEGMLHFEELLPATGNRFYRVIEK